MEWLEMMGSTKEWLWTLLWWVVVGGVAWYGCRKGKDSEGWKEHAEWHYKQEDNNKL